MSDAISTLGPEKSLTALDRVLIPEILHLIFSHLGKRDLFALLTICQGWSKLSLELLWRSVSLVTLLKIIGPLVEKRGFWCFLNPPGPEDLARFRSYSRLVHKLKHRDQDPNNDRPFVLTMDTIRWLHDEGVASGNVFPRLKELEWTISWRTDTASQLATFFSPTLKSLQVDVYINDNGVTNASLLNLARRADIELEHLGATSNDSDLEGGLLACLCRGWNVRSLALSAPQVKIGGPLDTKLDSLSDLHSFFAVIGDTDEAEGDGKIVPWLTTLNNRFHHLTFLGLSFDRRSTRLPNLPLRHMAPLLRSSTLLRIKLGFNPSTLIEEVDVLEVGRAWPALQSLWIYNWGSGAARFPLNILSSFAMHMPPSLGRLSLAFESFSVTSLPVHHSRFPALRVLALGYSHIVHDDRPAVAAYLASLCPPGLVLQRLPDLENEVDNEEEEDVAEVMALMTRYHGAAVGAQKATQAGM